MWWQEEGQALEAEPLKQIHLVKLLFKTWSWESFINWLLGPRSPCTVSHIAALDIAGTSSGEAINPLLQAIGGSLRLCRLNALALGYGLYGESTLAPFNEDIFADLKCLVTQTSRVLISTSLQTSSFCSCERLAQAGHGQGSYIFSQA